MRELAEGVEDIQVWVGNLRRMANNPIIFTVILLNHFLRGEKLLGEKTWRRNIELFSTEVKDEAR